MVFQLQVAWAEFSWWLSTGKWVSGGPNSWLLYLAYWQGWLQAEPGWGDASEGLLRAPRGGWLSNGASGFPKRVHELGKDCSSLIMPEPAIWCHVLSCLLYFIGERKSRSTCIQEGGDIGNLPSMGCVSVKTRAAIFNRPPLLQLHPRGYVRHVRGDKAQTLTRCTSLLFEDSQIPRKAVSGCQ